MHLPFSRRRALAMLAAGTSPLFLGASARASDYPAKPVKILVGAVPGGPSDFLGRLFADSVGPQFSQSFVIDNRPGSSGMLATEAAARAAGDGYTLVVSGPGAIASAPHLYPKMAYNPATDLVPVAMLGAGAFALVVHPSLPVHNVQELIALAKSRPGALNFGSGGNGSSGQLCTELFCMMAGIRMTHVPYKGDGQALNDILGGQFQVFFTAPNVAMPHVKSGKLRLLALTSRDRVATLPEVPTVHESGVRDFEYLGWIVMFAPAATPRSAIDALATAWGKGRATPTVRAKLEELAMLGPERLVSGPPLAEFIKAETARQGQIIRSASIKLD